MANTLWLPQATRKTWTNPRTGASYWDGGAKIRSNPLLIWHTTEGHQSLPGYHNSRGQAGGFAPNFTIVVKKRQFFQHTPLDRAGRALPAYNEQGVQVEITGSCSIAWSKKAGLVYVGDFDQSDLDYINQCMKYIADACGIPWTAPFKFDTYENLGSGRTNVRKPISAIVSARGIVGHQHVPGSTHIDPGVLGNMLLASVAVKPLPEPKEELQDLSPLTSEQVKRLQTFFQVAVKDGKTSAPSAWIQALQRSLNGKLAGRPNFKVLEVDGMCGPATRAAIQLDLGVKTWKEVPAAWMKRLDDLAKPPVFSAQKIGRVLKPGDKGDDVRLLQSTMRNWFSYAKNLAEDGSYRSATQTSVKEFQRRAKVSGNYADDIDGIVGPNTLKAMRAIGMKL